MSRRRWLFLAALLPQLLVLGLMTVRAELTLRHGEVVDLEVVAYDPIDPLAGRYMDVRLAIQAVDADLLWGPVESFGPGAPVWVQLTRDTPAQVTRVLPRPPDPGELFVRGTVSRPSPRSAGTELEFGLSRFYFSSSGVDPDRHRNEDGSRPELRLRVRLRDGHPTAETLLVDGVPYAEWNAALPREDR